MNEKHITLARIKIYYEKTTLAEVLNAGYHTKPQDLRFDKESSSIMCGFYEGEKYLGELVFFDEPHLSLDELKNRPIDLVLLEDEPQSESNFREFMGMNGKVGKKEMRVFESEIRELIASTYWGKVEDETLYTFPILVLPDKKTAFHIIPVHAVKNEDMFAYLSERFQQQGFRLIHLWEDFWIQNRDIMESRIKLILGRFIRIHARKTKVQRIDAPTAKLFLNSNHLYGSPASKHKYGLYYNEVLVAVASFTGLRTYWREGEPYKSSELVRFANLTGHSVTGGLSKLLAFFINDRKPDDIMTYADRDWSNGESYEKIGFKKIEYTPPQQFWVHPDKMLRCYAHRLPSNVSLDFQHQNEFAMLDDYLINNDYIPIFNAGNIKYLLLMPRL